MALKGGMSQGLHLAPVTRLSVYPAFAWRPPRRTFSLLDHSSPPAFIWAVNFKRPSC